MKETPSAEPTETGDLDDSDENVVLLLGDLHSRYDNMISKLEKLNAEALNMRFEGTIKNREAASSKESFCPDQSGIGGIEVF